MKPVSQVGNDEGSQADGCCQGDADNVDPLADMNAVHSGPHREAADHVNQ